MAKIGYNPFRLTVPILFLILSGCDRILSSFGDPELNESPVGDPILYESSFETSNSLDQWTIKPLLYTEEAAPGGGIQCIRVSGGCIAPHASIDDIEVEVSGDYIIEAWGRALIQGGMISLRRGFYEDIPLDRQYTYVYIDAEGWQEFVSEPLYLERGEIVDLSMTSGGIDEGAMLVDRLKIYKID